MRWVVMSEEGEAVVEFAAFAADVALARSLRIAVSVAFHATTMAAHATVATLRLS